MENLGDWSQWISALGYQPYTVDSRDDFVPLWFNCVSNEATMQHTTSTTGVTVTILAGIRRVTKGATTTGEPQGSFASQLMRIARGCDQRPGILWRTNM